MTSPAKDTLPKHLPAPEGEIDGLRASGSILVTMHRYVRS